MNTDEITPSEIDAVPLEFRATYAQSVSDARRVRYYAARERRIDWLEMGLIVGCSLALGALIDRILVSL